MFFRIMDYSEYMPNIHIPSWQDVAFHGVRCYTWLSIMWYRYFTPNWNDDTDDYPFAIVGKNALRQVVYYSDIEETEYKFISGVVRVNDRDEYDLSLRPFCVVGNRILDKDFVRWYLKQYYQVAITPDDNYEVYLMDHNCEQVNVMSDQYIKLNKDNYLKINYDE
jgi:hypothetical protein